ncbi:MAG: diguanylate cyclase domain-containing protein [Acidimicrobiia bacterium]|jgi:diguanylate cyclase (GGDEF)-like protein/PAS domain S-box-containing protein
MATSRRVRRRRIERLRAEHAALVVAEEQLRLSIDAAPIGVAFVATDGSFLRVNEALCEILGYEADELAALRFQDITHPEDLEADLELVGQVLRGELDRYTLEKRYLRRDGDVVHVQLDVSLVRDQRGSPLHFISQIQDITERKATLDALVHTEAVQRASLDALEQGVGMLSLTGEVLLLNEAGQRILGYTAAEMTERFRNQVWESYDEEGRDLPEAQRPIVHTLSTGEPVSDEVISFRVRDGRLVVLRMATQPVHDESGSILGVVVAFTDITEQRRMERAEHEARRRLEWQAYHDPLTELPNRTYLREQLEARLARAPKVPVALLYLDLDDFKLVNDTMGHNAGDELLAAVGDRLRSAVRDGDVVARFGGDEFVVLALNVRTRDGATQLAERLAAALAPPVALSDGTVETSASIGVVFEQGRSADSLLRDADTALYRAKQEGRGRYEMAKPSDIVVLPPR